MITIIHRIVYLAVLVGSLAFNTAQAAAMDTQADAPAAHGATTVTELYPGEADDVGPQVALAVPARRVHLEVMADSQYYHTSNFFLTEDSSNTGLGREKARVLLNTVEVAAVTDPSLLGGGEFQPRAGYRQQWFTVHLAPSDLFSVLSARDVNFVAQTAFMEARYRYHKQWIFDGGVDFTRLLYPDKSSFHERGEFYSELQPRWGVRRIFTLDDTRAVTVAYQGAYHATAADQVFPNVPNNVNDRWDSNLVVNYTQAITPKFIVEPSYHFKQTDYTNFADGYGSTGRHDRLHSLGASVYYYFLPEISARAFASYEIKDSTAPDRGIYAGLYDYKKFDAGVALNLDYRF